MIIAALLLLLLFFTGLWIVTYVDPQGNPWGLVPWFAGAAGVIVVVGLLISFVRARLRGD
jgi:hypothetical protein